MESSIVNDDDTLDDLKEKLHNVKQQLSDVNDYKKQLVTAIANHPDVKPELKEEGTTTVEGMKIVTGWNRNWNQPKLEELRAKVKPEFFPFRTKFEENRRDMKALTKLHPDLVSVYESEALTLTPKQPTIDIIPEED